MQEKLDKIDERLDNVNINLTEIRKDLEYHTINIDTTAKALEGINTTLQRNTASLELHMRRTDAIESHVKEFESKLLDLHKYHSNIEFTIAVIKFVGLPTVVAVVGFILRKLW